jgi:multisubunit Na+/H+ antiporter MnhG subunit
MTPSRLKDQHRIPSAYLVYATLAFLITLWYAWARIWDVDEGWTFVAVKSESIQDLLAYRHFNIANNHLLNSLWFKFMQSFGCKNVLFYRGLSLLSFFPYAYFLYRAAAYQATGRVEKWLPLFFLPPVMFYFSAGRGYALAITAFCGSLYYLQTCIDDQKAVSYWKFIICGAISSLAIVSFFYPFAAMLIYLYAGKYRTRLFTPRAVISGVLLLGLTAYIYYIGKTILLNDKIINGTDNLFNNGMYSTFFGTLGLSDLIQWPTVYTQLHLEMVSKILVIVTFLPVAAILLWKYLRQYFTLPVLFIATLLFLLGHIVMHAKYPSDRSALYLLFLIYIPVILVIAGTGNKLFRAHYYTAFLFGALNLIGFFYELSQPNIYSTLAQMPANQYTVYSDWPNYADGAYTELYFGGRITFHYLAKSFETNLPLVDQKIKAALTDPHADFLLLQTSAYLRNKDLFNRGFTIQPVISSGIKELYLIKRETVH